VRRLVCLAYEALREVTSADASSQAAAVMYAAIRDLFELFCDIVPFYHRQRITTAPLHAGSLMVLFCIVQRLVLSVIILPSSV